VFVNGAHAVDVVCGQLGDLGLIAAPLKGDTERDDRKEVKRFRGGLVFEAHRLFVSLNSRLESNKEEEEDWKEVLSQSRQRSMPPLAPQP